MKDLASHGILVWRPDESILNIVTCNFLNEASKYKWTNLHRIGSRSVSKNKKYSLPASSRPVPVLSLNSHAAADDDDDFTRQLESAVRKMSRGSPNLTSPNRMSRTSPSRFCPTGATYLTDLSLSACSNRIGLSGLARGYEQYRESLMSLRPATEFGEASSDDLSSEWDSCSESDSSPIAGVPFIGYPVGVIRRQTPGDLPDSILEADQSSGEEVNGEVSNPRPNSKRERVSYNPRVAGSWSHLLMNLCQQVPLPNLLIRWLPTYSIS